MEALINFMLLTSVMSLKGYVTDGTPRMRGKMKRIVGDDDECGLDEVPRPEFVSFIFLWPNLNQRVKLHT